MILGFTAPPHMFITSTKSVVGSVSFALYFPVYGLPCIQDPSRQKCNAQLHGKLHVSSLNEFVRAEEKENLAQGSLFIV